MTTTLAELIREATESRLRDLFTAAIGSVVAYDPTNQTAQVRLVVNIPISDENGGFKYLESPIIQDVPICFLRAGGYSITFPVSTGDTVLMIFTQLDASKWRNTGGVSVSPQTVKLHALGHGFAMPLVAPRDSVLTSAAEPALVILGDEIRIGASTSVEVDAVALATKVKDDNQLLFDAINNATTAPNDGGAALKASIISALTLAGYPHDVGSSNVKASK